ncbi:SDR family oxidoreductase [Halovenus salina]|uniref:SDR family oxidoreductase n=1 Tax=Halovenus salina TaxID=1510225 RepID=A0ABD5W8B1_9EURY|nr:SDR family oxidoreductase [Halovenus salina]
MTDDDFELSAPELSRDDLLVLDDPRFTRDTVAIVTGAASGIGRATAVALAANGLTVVGADIDDDGLAETERLAAAVDAEGKIDCVQTDLTDEDDVDAMVAAASDDGQLRYVANIAGMQHIDPISEFPMNKYDLLQDVMVRAPFVLSKCAMPHIKAADDGVGAIANMSSVHGHYATRDKAAYITAKHAITGLTRAIAAEGDGTLRGFSVSVGYVLTPLMLDQIADTAESRGISEQAVVEDVMLGQARTKTMMTPAEVANLFVFGFSQHANHLNGSDLCWDGGYTTTYE